MLKALSGELPLAIADDKLNNLGLPGATVELQRGFIAARDFLVHA